MAATVATLRKLGTVTPGLRRAAADLRKAAGRMGTAKTALTSQVGAPIKAGKGWLGAGQPEASVVVQVNTKAMATTNLRLSSGASALDKMAAVLEAVSAVWQTFEGNADLVIAADGTVTTPRTDHSETDAALTAEVKALLKRVDDADSELLGKLNAVVGEVPPVTTSASPGVLARAKSAYEDAKEDGAVDAALNLDWHPLGNWAKGALPSGLLFPGPAFYGGGGFLTGPDGRRYPIVVPSFENAKHGEGTSFGRTVPDSRVYAHRGGNGSHDLWGRDRGWYTVDRRAGLSQFTEEADLADLVAGGIAQWKPLGSVDADGTRELAEDGHVDPEQPQRDLGKPHENPYEKEPPAPRQRIYENTGRVKSAHDLLVSSLDGAGNAAKADDAAHYAYEARFEENVDGRRRAVVEVSQVVVTEVDGEPTASVRTNYFYVGEDGEAAFENGHDPHHEGDEVGPTR